MFKSYKYRLTFSLRIVRFHKELFKNKEKEIRKRNEQNRKILIFRWKIKSKIKKKRMFANSQMINFSQKRKTDPFSNENRQK